MVCPAIILLTIGRNVWFLSCPSFSPPLRLLVRPNRTTGGGRVPDDLVIRSVCSLSRFGLRVNQIFQLLREGAQVFDEMLRMHVAARGARQLLSKQESALGIRRAGRNEEGARDVPILVALGACRDRGRFAFLLL